MRRKVANPLALAVLAHLVMGPMHPYEMGKFLKETGKDRNIKYNRGSLYMVVEQLRKAGFIVEQETVKDTQRPERTVYALTDEGRDEMLDWMRELVSSPQHEYPAFGVALSLISVLSPTEAVELLRQRVGALAAAIEEARKLISQAGDQGVEWVFLVEEEYRIRMLDTELRFVTDLISSLEGTDYRRMWEQAMGREP
jgi:DNA-binding PadR family transcriptional regulator